MTLDIKVRSRLICNFRHGKHSDYDVVLYISRHKDIVKNGMNFKKLNKIKLKISEQENKK